MLRLGLLFCALLVAGGLGTASIERLNLTQMVSKTDHAVYGEITAAHVFKATEASGSDHYFTRLTIEGTSLVDQRPMTIDVTVYGGYLNENEGAYYSEAPSADDIRVGNRIVGFTKWSDDMGAGVASNVFYAAHGGLFRTVDGPRGTTVLGRGAGYAVSRNVNVVTLGTQIRTIRAERK